MSVKSITYHTFLVDEVVPVRTAKPTMNMVAALDLSLNNAGDRIDGKSQPVLYCSDRSSTLLEGINYHPFIASVHLAFAEHRPLVLSPDMIWTVILQGLAHHTHNHAEELRSRLVSHSGKRELVVSNEAIFPDSPESDWDVLIEQFTARLNENTLINTQSLISDFSTTGTVERLVSQICLLDVFEPYFEFIVYTICGIPEVLLEGSAEDWQRLRNKIDLLEPYDLNWWLPHLREIADELHNAATGHVNLSFWQNIYKRKDAYGYDVINGWIVKLIPYLKNGATGRFDVRNHLLEALREDAAKPLSQSVDVDGRDRYPVGISTASLPSGLSQVPFKVVDSIGQQTKMEMVAGFAGVEQLADSGALRSKLCWAVRRGEPSIWEFEFPSHLEVVPALDRDLYAKVFQGMLFHVRGPRWMPADVFSFYQRCDGLRFENQWQILGLQELQVMTEIDVRKDISYEDSDIIVCGDPYLRFFERGDGAFAVIHLDPHGDRNGEIRSRQQNIYEVDSSNKCTLVANSLSEFVKTLVSQT